MRIQDLLELENREQLEKILPALVGSTGKKYRVVAGTLRTDNADANKWRFLDDTGHTVSGISDVSPNSDGTVNIAFDFTAAKVVSLVVTPHRSAILQGYACAGTQVGLTSAQVAIKRICDIGGRVNYSTAFDLSLHGISAYQIGQIAEPFDIVAGVNDKLSISVDGGAAQEFTLTAGTGRTCAQITTDLSALTGATVATTSSCLKITSSSIGYLSKITLNYIAASAYTTLGMIVGAATTDDFSSVAVTNSSGSARIDHSVPYRLNEMPVVMPYAGGYIPHIQQWNTTYFIVDFYDYAGAKVTTPDANCKFLFSRQSNVLAHARQDPFPDGLTFWVFGVFEV